MALVDIYFDQNESVDRTAGIKEVVNKIPNIQNLTCTDLFAGDGSFCSFILAEKVKQISCIGYTNEAEAKIKSNIKTTYTLVGDTFKLLQENKLTSTDIAFCDNPQGILPNGTCEYFDYLDKIVPLINKGGYLIHNINILPYTYDENSSWANKRNNFYGVDSASNLSLTFMKEFHLNYFTKTLGRDVKSLEFIPREKYNRSVYLYFALYKLI